MRKWWNAAAALVVVAVLATALYVTAAPGDAPPPLRIGFVDFQQLVDQYDKMKDAKTELNALMQGIRAEAEKRQKEINQLVALLQQSAPGTEAHNKTVEQIGARRAAAKGWMDGQRARYAERSRSLMKDIYEDAEKAAAVYARINGLSLVLKDDPVKLDMPNPSEVELRITMRKVLYRADALDITDELAVAMNAAHKKLKEMNQ